MPAAQRMESHWLYAWERGYRYRMWSKMSASSGEEEPEEVSAYIQYVWDCPCGYDNRQENDPAGETVTCEDCDETFKCVGTS